MRLAELLASVIGLSLLSVSAHAVERIERGNLVMENVPAIPASLAETTNRYQQTRSAGFEGWLGRDGGVLISTRFGETAQVHLVSAPGASRTQLTFFAEPVAETTPAPDGQRFLFTKDVGGNEFFQVFEFDLASGDYRQLSDGKSRNTDLLWSNGGQQFAYSTTRRNGRDTDLVIGKPGSTDVRSITAREGSWAALDFAPDDARLLIVKYVSISESELYIADLGASKKPRLQRFHKTREPVSFSSASFSRDGRGIYFVSDENADVQRLRYENLDGSGAKVLSGDAHWDVEDVALSDDGRHLAYTLNADGISELRLLDLKTGKALPVPTLPIGVISRLAFDPAGQRLGFNLNSARSPSDVFSFDLVTKPVLTRWTRSETGGLNAASFTEPQLVHMNSFDGLRVPAFYYPAAAGTDDKAGKRRPLLIQIHGGPEAQALPTFNPLIEYYVRELGIAVLVPNVRGSSGYGKRYLSLDDGRLREDSVRDIGALLDWAKTRPELDADRIAVMGGSYGGYMTLASMTHYNDRLRGGIDIVGISNFVTFLTNTQDYRRPLRRVEYGDESDRAMRAFLERISPTTQASKITKPLFVIQGANDPRVPASEAEQMVKTVRGNGGEVWYLLAKDEGHGFRKKSNRDLYNNAVILFLQKILLEP